MKAFVGIYTALILVFALYGAWWGETAFKGFAYNLGRAIFWPVILFPSIGAVIGGVVIIGFITVLMLKKN